MQVMNKLLRWDAIDTDGNESPIVYQGFMEKIIEFETLEDLMNAEFVKGFLVHKYPNSKIFHSFIIERDTYYNEKYFCFLAKYIGIAEYNKDSFDTRLIGFLNEDIPEISEYGVSNGT